MTELELQKLHKHSSWHRDVLMQSKNCYCFHCLSEIEVKNIKEWTDKDNTAICPECHIDSILPYDAVHAIPKVRDKALNTEQIYEVLEAMNKFWFMRGFPMNGETKRIQSCLYCDFGREYTHEPDQRRWCAHPKSENMTLDENVLEIHSNCPLRKHRWSVDYQLFDKSLQENIEF